MFTRDDEGKLRLLGVRLADWPVMTALSAITLIPLLLISFSGWSLLQCEFVFAVYSPIPYFGIRMFYQMGKSRGKGMDWDRLPEILPGMVRAKVFTREQAIRIYDCFSYHSTLLERAWDLRSFAPLPPKRHLWFLEE